MMIVIDFETTGLIDKNTTDPNRQPKAIEVGAMRLDENLEEIGRLNYLVNPGEKLEPIITKITGIKDSDLTDKKRFAAHLPELTDFFLGETMMVAHNLPFDKAILHYELMRLDRLTRFPWPPGNMCTVEQTTHLKAGKFLKLEQLYELLFKKPANQTHRAIEDVEILVECIRELKKEGVI